MKPSWASWHIPFVFKGLIFLGLGYLALVVFLPRFTWVAIAIFVGVAWRRNTKYRYEEYSLDNGVQTTRGTYFTQTQTTIDYENITSISMRQPFWERIIYGTGSIQIKSAGSGASSTVLRHIPGAEETLQAIVDSIERSGTPLLGGEELHREKPVLRGVLTDNLSTLFNTVLSAVFFFLTLQAGTEQILFAVIRPFLGVLLGVIFLRYLIRAVAQAVDLLSHTYRVTDYLVEDRGGVFTKIHRIIPVNLISDTTIQQTFIERVFGVERLTISCRGVQDHHDFPFLPKATMLLDTIPTRAETDETNITGDGFQMQPIRAVAAPLLSLVPCVIFPPLLFLVVPFFGRKVVQAVATTYFIGKDEFIEKFKFFEVTTQRFSFEKVVAVKQTRNPLDLVLNTESIHLISVGSQENLVLRHLDAELQISDIIREELHVEKPGTEPVPVFSAQSFVTRWIPVIAVTSLLAALCIFFAPYLVLFFFPAPLFYAYEKLRAEHTEIGETARSMRVRKTFLFQSDITAWKSEVKYYEYKHYPGTRSGTMRLELPGDTIGKPSTSALVAPYIPQEYFSKKYYDSPEADIRSAMSNAVAKGFVAAVLTVILAYIGGAQFGVGGLAGMIGAVFSVILTTYIVVRAAKRRYTVSDTVFYAATNILYRKEQFVPKDNVEFSEVYRNVFNKVFGNGSVLIYTEGSTRVDMTVRNVEQRHIDDFISAARRKT